MFRRYRKPRNEELFACLFETFKNRVFGYILTITHSRYAAEELTQEVFLKLWLYRDELEKIKNHENYLFTIARNKTLNYLRKARFDEQQVQEMKGLMAQSCNNVDEQSAVAECNRLLEEAMTLLSPQRRHVYKLCRYEGLNHQQIADRLQLSTNTVKNHMVNALQFIRDYLGRHGVFLFLLLSLLF